MIKMKDYEYVRTACLKYGHKIREISRDTGISRPAIRKALKGQEPKYKRSKPKEKPVMGKHVEVVKNWLIADKKEPVKQRHTATRVYSRLVEEYGFHGGKSTVIDLVKQLKEELNLSKKEAFIPSDPDKRSGAEVDWGKVEVELNGKRTKCHMFCMRSKYSGKPFVKLYPEEIQECFFDGHIEAFTYYGGIYSELIYDNLTAAVKKVLTGKDRIEQSAFVSFRCYYCFAALSCNRNSGNEKGGVEGLVGYAERNFLTPVPKGKSFEEINAALLKKCQERDLTTTDGQRLQIGELFEHERRLLLKLPPKPYNNYKLVLDVLVDKYLTVKVKTNRYSVPCQYAGKKVNVELGLNDVRLIYKNKLIATHKRAFERQKWILDPWHYMEVLRRKSRAFKSSRILTAIEEHWDPAVKRLWETQVASHGEDQGTKDFLDSVLFFQDKNYEDMVTVTELALENRTTNKESIKMLYDMLMEEAPSIEKAETEHLEPISHFTLPAPDIDKFNDLLGVRNE